jgi:hypothetical protein
LCPQPGAGESGEDAKFPPRTSLSLQNGQLLPKDYKVFWSNAAHALSPVDAKPQAKDRFRVSYFPMHKSFTP